jgi:hypothetical protein
MDWGLNEPVFFFGLVPVMRTPLAALLVTLCFPICAAAQESYKVESLTEAPPDSLAPGVRDVLQSSGARVIGPDGKPLADIWLRKAIPASAKPAGPKGAVLFPNLASGELLGALRFLTEGHDYRDQAIPKGVYTLRYGVQPVNGDHLGVSVFRDYALMVSAAKDKDPATITQKQLETRSTETAGTSHPAVFMLVPAPADAKPPAIARDEEKNLWGVVLALPLAVKGEPQPLPMATQLIVVGAAMP